MRKIILFTALIANFTLVLGQNPDFSKVSGVITDSKGERLVNARYSYEKACQSHVAAQERLAVFLGTDKMEAEIPVFDAPLAIDPNTVLFYVKQNNPFSKQQEIQQLEAERNLLSASRMLFAGKGGCK